MVDWLEQLLEQSGAEHEPREREQLELKGLAWPAGGAAGGEAPVLELAAPAPGWMEPAGPAEEQGRAQGEDGPASPPGRARQARGAAVRRSAPAGGAAQTLLEQTAPALPGEQDEVLAPGQEEGLAPPAAGGAASPAQEGLLALYRQVQAAGWGDDAAQRAGVAVIREAALPQGELTLGQLDRAMRRDSRRYDGGMSIY